MLPADAWCLIVPVMRLAVATATTIANWQVQLGPPIFNWGDGSDFMGWSFDQVPQLNATEHLVFETVHSLLQHWPNTRMRNGHTIVPGTIPKGTLLYHAASRHESPRRPEWVATDPEHSFFFCKDNARLGKGCWQLTLATTRPLKVIYFDGNSAAKLPYGTLDTQDLIIWGRSSPEMIYKDSQRIEDLCKWGKDYGVDGFVRMEMDFEIALCDFTSGVEVVSFLNLVSTVTRQPSNEGIIFEFEVMNAGSWHNRFPGEMRVRLDLAGLVSFYDTQLVPSLVGIRASQERWDHRVQNISTEDLSAAKSRLTEALARSDGQSSGIDWATLLQVVVDRYAGRLEIMQYLLNLTATDPNEIIDLALKAQTQLRVMVTPYALLSAVPVDTSNKTDLDWVIPIFKLCSTTHTSSLDSEVPSMTPSERLLLRSVRGTTREICRVVTKMWAAGVYAGLDPYLNTKELIDIDELSQLRLIWVAELARLMSWLDWSVWVKCKPACGPEELCYLPTWPTGFPRRDSSEIVNRKDSNAVLLHFADSEGWNDLWPVSDEWIRPQPKCIRRMAPYGF